jgi:DNA-binding beta-propeller fold protein YncE
MHRNSWIICASLVFIAAAGPAGAATVPPPAGGSWLTALATDGSGTLYACDGNTVWRLQGGAFAGVYSGVRSTAGASVDPSGFAVSAGGGQAYVATGYTSRLVEVNLSAPASARELSGARDVGGSSFMYGNYGVAIDPIYGKIFVTDSTNQDLYLLNPSGSGSLTLLKSFSGSFGGGLAFSPTGELYIPVPTAYGVPGTADNFPVDLYRFSRGWLDDVAAGRTPATDAVRYAQDLSVSGTNFVAVDGAGTAYLQAADAIYSIRQDGSLGTFLGDPSKNVFLMGDTGYRGLAYDPVSDQLYYGYRDASGQSLELGAHAAPEPATLALVGLGLAGFWARRRKGKGSTIRRCHSERSEACP